MAEIFGFEIKRSQPKQNSQSFTAPTADDGVQTIMGGGHFGKVYIGDLRIAHFLDNNLKGKRSKIWLLNAVT